MTSIRTGLDSLRASLSFDLGCALKSKTQKMLQTIRGGMRSGRKVVRDCWMKMAISLLAAFSTEVQPKIDQALTKVRSKVDRALPNAEKW